MRLFRRTLVEGRIEHVRSHNLLDDGLIIRAGEFDVNLFPVRRPVYLLL